MAWQALAPWVLDALNLWLTADQEVELRELQELLRSATGSVTAETTPRAPYLGSGDWFEDQDWLELQRATEGNRRVKSRGPLLCFDVDQGDF